MKDDRGGLMIWWFMGRDMVYEYALVASRSGIAMLGGLERYW